MNVFPDGLRAPVAAAAALFRVIVAGKDQQAGLRSPGQIDIRGRRRQGRGEGGGPVFRSIGLHARPDGECEAGKQSEDHHAAMAEMAPGAHGDQIDEIAPGRDRGGDEIGKACMAGANETPDQAQDDQPADQIAGPEMAREKLVLGELGDEESGGQGPAEDAHQEFPGMNGAGRPARLFGGDGSGHCGGSIRSAENLVGFDRISAGEAGASMTREGPIPLDPD